MRPELDNVLQCLSLNGYSIVSLIDDILTHGCDRREDQRIMLLREGVERDAAAICTRLLGHSSTSASISAWALGIAQSTLRPKVEETARREQLEQGLHFMTDHPLSLRNNSVFSPRLFSGIAWTSTDGIERVLNLGRAPFKNYRHAVTIDMLPDNVFLEIFAFRLLCSIFKKHPAEAIKHMKKWRRLVHVCQRWRKLIFASPRSLGLHICCSNGTPVRRNLGFWPTTLPLTVHYHWNLRFFVPKADDNPQYLVAALEHASRVHRIGIFAPAEVLTKVTTVMRKSFPALTHLDLGWSVDLGLDDFVSRDLPVIPRRFLGGSAPHLQYLRLQNVCFPNLPKFLLSARNIITLELKDIPHGDYTSPEAMVGCLVMLTKLQTLAIAFDGDSERPYPYQRTGRPDPPTRYTLPALTAFRHRGYSEYLEDFLAQVDTPQIDNLRIEYFMPEIQVPQLSRFIDRTENLKLNKFRRAEVAFYCDNLYIGFDYPEEGCHQAQLSLNISGQRELGLLGTQVSCVAHVLGQLVDVFSNVGRLLVHGEQNAQYYDMDSAEWLPFFHLFSAVEALHLSGGVATFIYRALEDVAEEMVANVLPALHLIWLDKGNYEDDDDADDENDGYNEPVGSIERFLSSRWLSGCPVTVVNTEDDFNKADRRSY